MCYFDRSLRSHSDMCYDAVSISMLKPDTHRHRLTEIRLNLKKKNGIHAGFLSKRMMGISRFLF